MSEPVIEVVTECVHGLIEPHDRYQSRPLEAGSWGMAGGSVQAFQECPGGSRVQYTRQEAIDRLADMFAAEWEIHIGQAKADATSAVDALLGDNQ